jgi:hypothetical protein
MGAIGGMEMAKGGGLSVALANGRAAHSDRGELREGPSARQTARDGFGDFVGSTRLSFHFSFPSSLSRRRSHRGTRVPVTSPIRRSPASPVSSLPRWRGRIAALSLLVSGLLTPPAEAGITFGRDQLNGSTTVDFTGPVCTPGCTLSQTCTTLGDYNTGVTTNLCLNKTYPFSYVGDWQPQGRNYQVGNVVSNPVTGEAYVFVDVSVSTQFSNVLRDHPLLSDTNSWQLFSGLVSDLPGASGTQGPAGPQGPSGVAGANGDTGPAGQAGATGASGAGLFPGATILVPQGRARPRRVQLRRAEDPLPARG